MSPQSDDPVIREAEKARQRSRAKADRKARRNAKRSGKTKTISATSPDSDRLKTWWRVGVPVPNLAHAFAWVFAVGAVAGLIIAFVPVSFVRIFTEYRVDVLLLRALSIVVMLLAVTAVASAVRFISWRRRLPYLLTGWEAVVDFEGFGDDEQWRQCTVTIDCSSNDQDDIDVFHAALVVFSERAGGRYYPSDDSSRRKEWSVAGLSASGSANRHVVREFKRMCEGNLARLQNTYGCLVSVRIEVTSDRVFVSRPTGGGAP